MRTDLPNLEYRFKKKNEKVANRKPGNLRNIIPSPKSKLPI